MADRYRRKSTQIEAVQWDGTAKSHQAIRAIDARVVGGLTVGLRLLAGKAGAQGWVDVPVGHWIAKAAVDDFYPIAPDVFAATYEAASRDEQDEL